MGVPSFYNESGWFHRFPPKECSRRPGYDCYSTGLPHTMLQYVAVSLSEGWVVLTVGKTETYHDLSCQGSFYSQSLENNGSLDLCRKSWLQVSCVTAPRVVRTSDQKAEKGVGSVRDQLLCRSFMPTPSNEPRSDLSQPAFFFSPIWVPAVECFPGFPWPFQTIQHEGYEESWGKLEEKPETAFLLSSLAEAFASNRNPRQNAPGSAGRRCGSRARLHTAHLSQKRTPTRDLPRTYHQTPGTYPISQTSEQLR